MDQKSTFDMLLAHKDSYPIVAFFACDHLPPELQAQSRPFMYVALQMVETVPRNPETAAGLRKLLEAKDCAVRAALDLTGGQR